MDQDQFRTYIVRPILTSINLWSQSAEHLIVGTAECESGLQYVKQKNGGIAVSLMQIEPATYKDLRKRLISDYTNLYDRIKTTLYLDYFPEVPDYLIGNVGAAVVFARLKYFFNPAPLPDANDYESLAKYYKKIYNTADGAATIERSTKIFRSVVLGYVDTLSARVG